MSMGWSDVSVREVHWVIVQATTAKIQDLEEIVELAY